ncbi:4-(cytidine 5'-diphospho)-2-C-methyl-D-erythritol kinase [Asticcacaulis excentricus]|uniref:4-diphosphocytidyl-2-C-methyl-D-erythritol kinase n=1 Tax=Asticcacaulis excentricus (strain ATCC 15261 / DSM 4724 / KCTC 12464 / NCIMB 9791 / VKM B-1370 / CB 48) TaxID=573065 RepID=E8RTD8_ASTEC|nr:4-(cytidine 5'-diphospho)-2-C-methyl-D-erythritol kinase [Asticcacaulis excentricus]ADU14759.1 4-diphosphocytidyl-2C-methyl-D-erythritol kinase [Asticcacaulis excentricus CB 48]
MKLLRLAPAKVNLYLHVAAPDHRGYHPLRSLVVFADYGDEVRLTPGEGRMFIDGPFGQNLSPGEDNLVLKAVRRFEAATSVRVNSHDFHLTKNLPLASGVGGGSADAGAVLHLLRATCAPEVSDNALSRIAAETGADGVMCLWARAAIAEGYGERLTPVAIPPLPAVLINPGVECPTPAVFKAYDSAAEFAPIDTQWRGEDVIDDLNTTRNDLEAPAIRLVPVIGEVLASLRAQPETRFARMSGSGATCFALCDTLSEAETLAARLRADWPKAWVRACTLK